MAKQAGTVDAILRAFTILEYLAETPEGSTVTELARTEDVHKALTHRALASLTTAGYVVHDAQSQRYRLTPRLLALAMGYYDSLGLRGVAGPVMQAVADETGCNAEFTRYMDGELRILMWVPPQRRGTPLQVVSRPGDVQTPHATAAGKVWLASLSQGDVEAFLAGRALPRLGPRTIVDRDALLAELDLVRAQGYALNLEEDGPGVFALTVPIHPQGGTDLLGTLGLTRPIADVDEASINTLFAAARAAAQALGAMLPRGEELTSLSAGRSF